MSQYEFVDTGPTIVGSGVMRIVEKFRFGEFDSSDYGWWLVDRSAPSPGEKVIAESIPYMQGVLDFSTIGNDRFFNNRDVTYQIKKVGYGYADRKVYENELKNKLMPQGIQVIKDTHEDGLHWLGKCKSITVTDEQSKQYLTATIVFDCYPFAIGNLTEGNDIWDETFFPDWVFQNTTYTVNGSQTINLLNIGAKSVEVEIIVTGNVDLSGTFGKIKLSAGTYRDTEVVIYRGDNSLVLSGKGTIEFKFYKEVMI